MISTLNDDQIEKLLKECVFGRIGCCNGNFPYVVPTSYAYDGEYIYVHTLEGMKIDIMRRNNHVCFEVDNTNNMDSWQSVIAWGMFEEITGADDRTKAIKYLASRILPGNPGITTRLGSLWPFASGSLDDVKGIVFRIKLTERTGRFGSMMLMK